VEWTVPAFSVAMSLYFPEEGSPQRKHHISPKKIKTWRSFGLAGKAEADMGNYIPEEVFGIKEMASEPSENFTCGSVY